MFHIHAKSLQLCPTLCDPIDGSPPGSPVPGILKARTLEWVAISFSNAWEWKWYIILYLIISSSIIFYWSLVAFTSVSFSLFHLSRPILFYFFPIVLFILFFLMLTITLFFVCLFVCFLLYNTVLVLPYIDMNPPQVSHNSSYYV